jgi:hypothetical protein
MQVSNSTSLKTDRLVALLQETAQGWPVRRLRVRVRYSRGADFSGTCYYKHGLIHVNLGRHVRYPYRLGTSIARAESNARYWWKPIYTVELADAYQLVLFVFLHELYHWLVQKARRNPRQKESMCDRFAVRILVDRFGCPIRDEAGHPVARESWDFQDVTRFVADARTSTVRPTRTVRSAAKRPVPERLRHGEQLLLFEV